MLSSEITKDSKEEGHGGGCEGTNAILKARRANERPAFGHVTESANEGAAASGFLRLREESVKHC